LNFRILLKVLWCLLWLPLSCNKKVVVKEIDSVALIEQVKSRVDAFHMADTTLNSDGVVDLLWPEFIMLADGNYIAYDNVREGTKAFMASLESFDSEWKNVRIIPIGNHHAISSFIFTDSLVAKDGTISQSQGPNTFVWEKRDGIWKVIYGDVDHYPME